MDDIGFKPFDFAKVASLQYKKLAAEADKKGEVCLLPQNVMSFDCRLDYRWKNVDFTLNEYSVGSVIGLYAKYSDDITRLEKLLDLFWDECGVSPFLIERDDEPPNHSTEPTAHRNVC